MPPTFFLGLVLVLLSLCALRALSWPSRAEEGPEATPGACEAAERRLRRSLARGGRPTERLFASDERTIAA